jgi:hypothetical protein
MIISDNIVSLDLTEKDLAEMIYAIPENLVEVSCRKELRKFFDNHPYVIGYDLVNDEKMSYFILIRDNLKITGKLDVNKEFVKTINIVLDSSEEMLSGEDIEGFPELTVVYKYIVVLIFSYFMQNYNHFNIHSEKGKNVLMDNFILFIKAIETECIDNNENYSLLFENQEVPNNIFLELSCEYNSGLLKLTVSIAYKSK